MASVADFECSCGAKTPHRKAVVYSQAEGKCKGFYCPKCKQFTKPIGREKGLTPNGA